MVYIQKLDTDDLKGMLEHRLKVKLGRQNSYLYSIANSGSGESSSLFAMNANIYYMNIFLEQMLQYLRIREALLI